jgi:hypothetical protein
MNRASDFIKYATFVEAVEKIQLGNKENLAIDEKKTLKALVVSPEVEDVSEEDSDENDVKLIPLPRPPPCVPAWTRGQIQAPIEPPNRQNQIITTVP